MKIAIGATSVCLAKGGTERAAVNLANELTRRGHEVVILCEKSKHPPMYAVNKVPIYFYPRRFKWGYKPEVEKVRNYLRQESFDTFISMQWDSAHMMWALACIGTGIPFICSERSDPRYSEAVRWSRPGRHAVLAAADYIHELTPAHIETTPAIWSDKIKIIPNTAPVHSYRAKPETSPLILFLGRFVATKRVDLLIDAFALLTDEFPDWHLNLRGQGAEEDNLRKLIKKHNLEHKISIRKPMDDNVFAEYAMAGIYCLPTQVEGFPNTVLEAMSCGLPVVGIHDCPAMSSLADQDAALVAAKPEPVSLAAVLRKLMTSSVLRTRMSAKALELCRTVYEKNKIYDQWEELLTEAAKKKGRTIMDSFSNEPFASMAILSSAVRKEWLYRHAWDPMPYTAGWLKSKLINFSKNIFHKLRKADV